MIVRGLLLVLSLGSLAACATPSERISTALQARGLDEAPSECVGQRLDAALSIGQLLQLKRATEAYNRNDVSPGRLTASDLVRVSAAIDDPRVPLEVGRAVAACNVLQSLAPAPAG